MAAYQLRKTATPSTSNADYIVQDSKLNTDTMISFIGHGTEEYGGTLQQNVIDLLTNFYTHAASDYTRAIPGQLVYVGGDELRLYTSKSDYKLLNVVDIPA